ncbi:unnamed protein product [Lactuca saligna]|uniref:Uncharacterized protein n=1 Tax=Lactuca saligna TaxID=75948 RepID=A0AA35VKT3_LACSI|nr:unnamed protein product [Lactuca saligna]
MPMESLANSAMEVASRSLASNDCSTRFTVGCHSFLSIVRVKRWNGVTRAITTEPKPKAVNPRTSRILDGSSINNTSTRMETVSQEIRRVRAQMEENEQLLMDLLFSFLEPTRSYSALLAGYFSKVHQNVLQQLVDLIGITSIMEVLVRLVGADDHMYLGSVDVMQWLTDSNLLEMIVDKLSPSSSLEVHSNATETLCAITRNTSSPLASKLSTSRVTCSSQSKNCRSNVASIQYPFNNDLHHHIESIIYSCLESTNNTVIDHLFQGCRLFPKILQTENNPFHSGEHIHIQESIEWNEWQATTLQDRNMVENVYRWACGCGKLQPADIPITARTIKPDNPRAN